MSAAIAVSLEDGGDARAFVDALVSDRTSAEALEAFRAMVLEANTRMNLIGASTLDAFWLRHVIDSAQLLWFAPDARVWADLGTGAGFPGVVLAILLRGRPLTRIHLIESMSKRCAFLADVARILELPVEVHNARAEALRLDVQVVTARACAPLSRLLGYAWPCFERGARGLFLKGRGADEEVARARAIWRFRVLAHPSLSDPAGRVLAVSDVSRRA
jgi:16S rRNA (guanine527-N7)-methyltransferase